MEDDGEKEKVRFWFSLTRSRVKSVARVLTPVGRKNVEAVPLACDESESKVSLFVLMSKSREVEDDTNDN